MKKVIKNKTNKKTYLVMLFGIIIGVIISIASSYALAETLIKSADVSYVDNAKLGATNVQAAIDGTCTKFSNDLQSFLLKVYPVGSIYISYNSTNPGTLFGGTWENYGNGRVLKGINSGTAGATGGSSTLTLSMSNIPAHTHTYDKANANTGSHTLTIDEIPSHTHEFVEGGYTLVYMANTNHKDLPIEMGFSKNQTGWLTGYNKNSSKIASTGGSLGHTHTISTTSANTGSAGSSTPTAISVQDPYITVYMWRRTK